MITSLIEQRGSVGELHALDPFAAGPLDGPQVWWCRPTDDAIVLGSRQTPELLDADACASAGLSVVRRRSGGGAVLIRRDAMVWIDLVLPHGLAPDDVRGAMVWAGERWRGALVRAAGIEPGRLVVHRGGMVDMPWSDLVCFAGVGPGEVLLDGAKLAGLSQRRTKAGIRIQGLLHTRPLGDELMRLLSGPLPEARAPEPAFVAVAADRLVADLGDALTSTATT